MQNRVRNSHWFKSLALMTFVAFFLAGPVLAQTITEFSAGITPGARPRSIAAGPDGNLWFTQEVGNRVGRITPAGVVTEFSAGITASSGPIGITAGPDGNVWFTEFSGNRIGRITPSGTVTEFTAGAGGQPLHITDGPDGNLWFTKESGNSIGRITPAGAVTIFSAGITVAALPSNITSGPDGNLWFTERGIDQIARITPAGVVTEFPVPASQPQGITAGPDGNLWFNYTGGIGRITIAGVATLFTAGIAPGSTGDIANGPDGNLYYVKSGGDRFGKITTAGAVVEYTVGLTGGSLFKIATGPDQNLWATEYNTDRIARLSLTNIAPSFVAGPSQNSLEDAGPRSIVNWATALNDGDPAAVQALSFSVSVDSGTVGFAVAPAVSASGTLTFTSAPDSNGSANLSVFVTDNGGTFNGGVNQSAVQNFSITVAAVNDAPSFVAGANQMLLEDAGPQSIPGWATAIDDGEPVAVQTLNFVVTPISGTVNFSVFPTVSPTGTLSYTTAPDSIGSASFSVRLDDNGGTANGGINQSALQNFTVNVGPVNDAPSFVVGANQSVFEDAGVISVPAWATALDDGDPETVQTLNFVVTPISGTVNFSVFPTVSPTGTLSYTTAPDSIGSASFSVRLDDNGGTANGGINQSALQNFTVNVGPVNDAPSFVVGANQSVFEDAGAITVPGWATVDDGDPEVVQTLSFEITAISATVTFSAGPTISPTGTLSYTPTPNSFGSATITLRVNDDGGLANGGVSQSATQTFTITVIPVNDAPSFVAGANQNVLEDAGAVTVPGWATAINWNDGGVVQTVTFTVTPISGTVNFSGLPTISLTGTLSYTPAPNSAGSATFAVVAMDNGGTANGGVNQSPPQNFTIDVGTVNDAPSFVVGANQSVMEDAGANSVPAWATALDDGDLESVQNLNFTLISNSNPTLFAVAPTISPTGTLSYTSVANASGSATISLRLNDDGGTANGGVNQSAPQNFTITVAPVNDVPSFVVGVNQVLPPGTVAAQTISNWATAISDGDADFVQGLTFIITNDRNSMFAAQPSVAANGTLNFTPNGTSGQANISVRLTDDASAGGAALSTPVQTFSIIVRGVPTVTIEQRSPAATVVGEPFSVRVRVLNPTSSFQATGMITVALLPSGNPVQCSLAPIATPPGAAEAICNNVVSPIATAKLVQASYIGDAVFELGEDLSQHPVDKAATRLTILEDLPDPSMSNSPVAVRYLLEVLPPSLSAISSLNGIITLSDGQTESSAPFSPSNPISSIILQGNGARVLTASYSADGNFSNSSDTEDHQLIGGNNSDLAVAISNNRRFVPIAGETTYQVRVSNLGSISSNAQLDAFVPEGLENYRWTCSASVGSSCHAPSGNGTIVAGINILAGGNVSYTIRADVSAAEATLVRNTVNITPSLSPPDVNPANDTATDTDIVAVFVEGFEE